MNSIKRDLRNYPLYFLLWTVLGLFYFSQGLTQRLVSYDPTPWWHTCWDGCPESTFGLC